MSKSEWGLVGCMSFLYTTLSFSSWETSLAGSSYRLNYWSCSPASQSFYLWGPLDPLSFSVDLGHYQQWVVYPRMAGAVMWPGCAASESPTCLFGASKNYYHHQQLWSGKRSGSYASSASWGASWCGSWSLCTLTRLECAPLRGSTSRILGLPSRMACFC